MKPQTQIDPPEIDRLDRRIECALQVLRNAQPVDGTSLSVAASAFDAMNQRLLRGLRSSTGRESSASRWLRQPNAVFCATVFAAVCMAALLVALLHTHGNTSIPQTTRYASDSDRSIAQVDSPHRSNGTGPTVPERHTGSSPLASARVLTAATIKAGSPKSSAVDPAFLPSFPAPAAPLTREEKLLVGMVVHGAPTMLARLESRQPDGRELRHQALPDPLFVGFFLESPPPGPAAPILDPEIPSGGQPLSDRDREASPALPSGPEHPQPAALNESNTEPRP